MLKVVRSTWTEYCLKSVFLNSLDIDRAALVFSKTWNGFNFCHSSDGYCNIPYCSIKKQPFLDWIDRLIRILPLGWYLWYLLKITLLALPMDFFYSGKNNFVVILWQLI